MANEMYELPENFYLGQKRDMYISDGMNTGDHSPELIKETKNCLSVILFYCFSFCLYILVY